jgi:hypothetical protein
VTTGLYDISVHQTAFYLSQKDASYHLPTVTVGVNVVSAVEKVKAAAVVVAVAIAQLIPSLNVVARLFLHYCAIRCSDDLCSSLFCRQIVGRHLSPCTNTGEPSRRFGCCGIDMNALIHNGRS